MAKDTPKLILVIYRFLIAVITILREEYHLPDYKNISIYISGDEVKIEHNGHDENEPDSKTVTG